MAKHDRHTRQRQIQFFCDDLRQRGADARAEIDMAVERDCAAVVADGEKHIGLAWNKRRPRAGLTDSRLDRRLRRAHDDQHALRVIQLLARRHSGPAVDADIRSCHARAPSEAFLGDASSSAARCTARTISTCVPQRHRLRDNSRRIVSTLGCGSRSSNAFAVMIIPLRQ